MIKEHKEHIKFLDKQCKELRNILDEKKKLHPYESHIEEISKLEMAVQIKTSTEKYYKKLEHDNRVQIINGNLFHFVTPKSKGTNIIVHGCNAQGVMGSGFAKELRELYPKAYTTYNDHYNNEGLVIGDVIWYNEENLVIANAITQFNYGRDGKKYASYDAIDLCFEKINSFVEELNDDENVHIHFPALGSALGGLNWDAIQKIIESNIKRNVKLTLYIKE